MIINEVTTTGRINTCTKYILVTVAPLNEEPPNMSVAICFPISGVERAILMPMVAAPNASESQGSKYPE